MYVVHILDADGNSRRLRIQASSPESAEMEAWDLYPGCFVDYVESE